MSFIATKGKFHVALNGVGMLLQGAPDRLAYHQNQAPIYGQRFASGDRDYNDLSQWWYFVQTDWSGGLKDTVAWADDAKSYYSTNIDSWSENGAIKLATAPVLDTTLAENIICGALLNVAAFTYKFIGTDDNASNRPLVYQSVPGTGQAYTNISTTYFATSQNVISQLLAKSSVLWALAAGSGTTTVINTWDGSSWVDQTAYVDTLFTHASQASPCGVSFAGIMYIFRYNSSNNSWGLAKSSVSIPASGADWTLGFQRLNDQGVPVSCAVYDGKIYYLVNYANYMQLYAYDIASTVNTLVQTFNNTQCANYGVGDKLLVPMNGKLVITIPLNEIWELNGSVLTRIFVRDTYKKTTFNSAEANANLAAGCSSADNKLWWGNLMYNGTYFYNTTKAVADGSTTLVTNLFSDAANIVWTIDAANTKKIYANDPLSAAFKGTADKNFIVLNNFDKVAGVDKLAYSATILFKPLASGQSIIVEYFIGELNNSSTFTVLGTASATLDGTSVREKTFLFGAAVIYKKIWFRIKLEGGGTTTPTMNDIVMEYLPVPTYKKVWTLNANVANEVKKLDGRLVETTARELRAIIENAWWTKSLLDFQDLDYASTQINNGAGITATATSITVDNTVDFPEQGRLHIDDEEIFYTGKTPTTFTGLTRGARGTRAATHADDAVVNNAYKVIVTGLETRVPIALKDKDLEYVLGLTLREA